VTLLQNITQKKEVKSETTNNRDSDSERLLEVERAVVTCQNTAETHEAGIDINRTHNDIYELHHNKPQLQ